MSLAEYKIERTEYSLTVRRTMPWMLVSAVGVLLLIVPMMCWMWWELSVRPTDGLSRLLFLAPSVFMAAALYRLIFWGRCLVFDREQDLFLIDGRCACALSELSSVQMEATPGRPASRRLGRFLMLHMQTGSGRNIALKGGWERTPHGAELMHLSQEIAEFVGAQSRRV